MIRILLIGLLALGCSGAEDEPVECAQTDRSGTYLFQHSETSGNCGAIPDQLGQLDASAAVAPACTLDAPDRWTEADCKLERAYTCAEEGIGPGWYSTGVGVTEQQDSAGDTIAGLFTLTVYDASGLVQCKSTYELTATRQ
jgi:hypothetical protein